MENKDWTDRWAEGRIGFHKAIVNPLLERFGSRLPEGGRVLAPLSGKSLDLPWLRDRGHEVVASELAERGVIDFHREQQLLYDVEELAPFRIFRTPGITTWLGDFFELDPWLVGPIDAVYDRGAWVAIESSKRALYVETVLRFLRPGGTWLIISLDYDPSEMSGPPFALPDREITSSLANHGTLELLDAREILDEESHFRDKGLTALRESAHLFRRHDA